MMSEAISGHVFAGGSDTDGPDDAMSGWFDDLIDDHYRQNKSNPGRMMPGPRRR